jgi:predicted transcriptional regulator
MSTTSIKLPDALKERLAAVVKKQDRSAHAFMLQAIEKEVERAELQEDFHQVALARMRRFERTGSAVSMKEMDIYVKALVAGKNPPKPKANKVPGFSIRKK